MKTAAPARPCTCLSRSPEPAAFEPATGPGHIAVQDDGTVTITGTAGATTGFDGPFGPGTLIQSGNMQFAIHGGTPAARVRCTGNLYETRHRAPAGPPGRSSVSASGPPSARNPQTA